MHFVRHITIQMLGLHLSRHKVINAIQGDQTLAGLVQGTISFIKQV